MGQGYFKPVKDLDLIVHWSTFWDFPITWGKLEEFTLSADRLLRIEKYGSTWADEQIDYEDETAGLVFRMPYNHMELSGYLYYTNVPALLEQLVKPESRARTMEIEKLLIERAWS